MIKDLKELLSPSFSHFLGCLFYIAKFPSVSSSIPIYTIKSTAKVPSKTAPVCSWVHQCWHSVATLCYYTAFCWRDLKRKILIRALRGSMFSIINPFNLTFFEYLNRLLCWLKRRYRSDVPFKSADQLLSAQSRRVNWTRLLLATTG